MRLDIASSQRGRVRRLALGARIAALVLVAAEVRATTITVNTTADEVNADGDCSLREAILAANTNAAVDACSVGQSAATDVIALTPGATYDLTLPAPPLPADDPLGGDLDLADDTANPDVVVQTEGGEPAAILQTVLGQKVLSVNGTAEFSRVVVTGGGSADCGGGISFLGSGTSTVAGSTFAGNSAVTGGAICNLASGSQLLVSDSLFIENQAGGSAGGGAIRNVNGTTSVTGSVFLRNLAGGSGGAVSNNRNVAGALSITSSCLLDNTDVAVANAQDALQIATGNWWGHSSGPSGAGGGGGDSVDATFDFSDFSVAPNPSCFPMELVRNPGFERTVGGSGPLQSWKPTLLDEGDGQSCGDDNDCVLVLTGDGTRKRLQQTLRAGGRAGDVLVLTASSRAKNVPAGSAPYSVRAIVFHEDGSRETKTLRFSPGSHGFETLSKTIVANEDWKKVRVEIQYGRPGGTVRFDAVSLTFEAPPV